MRILSVMLITIFVCPAWGRHDWPERLQPQMTKITKEFDGRLGVFVKDLNTQITFSLYGDVWWYLASGTKLFVLIEVVRQIDAGKIQYDQPVTVNKSDYRDGAGRTNWLQPGSVTTVRFLMEQMMMESDNAATDLLIQLVGLESIRENLKVVTDPAHMGAVTTMLDVRKLAYAGLHPNALKLSNMDFFELKKAKTDQQKLEKFIEFAGVTKKELKAKSVDESFTQYYRQDFNSGTLVEFASVLERLAQGKVINARRSAEILELMAKCQTGKTRLQAGLPANVTWMHKTGTQRERICDLGIVQVPAPTEGGPVGRVAIAVCASGFKSSTDADRAMKKTAEAMTKAGVFGQMK